MQLPERIRRPLEKTVNNLQTRQETNAISLFGSWSRGDADPSSSDVDLLIVEDQPFEYEYTERIEQNGTLIDLDHVPLKWVTETAPPELDQKVHESYVLYDREWKLANAKEHMMNSFYTPERYRIRTENYLIDADIYLSRATSAQTRGDIQSAQLFAAISANAILRTIIEAAKRPLTCNRYLETLKKATEELHMNSLFLDYQRITRLENLNPSSAEERLSSFKQVWDEASAFTKAKSSLLESMHFKIKTKLRYYTIPAFLQGTVMRSQALLKENQHQEAAHSLFITAAELLENYAWMKAAEQGTRFDCTTLLRFVKGQKQGVSAIYRNSLNVLGIVDEVYAGREAEQTIGLARQVLGEVRGMRRMLSDGMGQETY